MRPWIPALMAAALSAGTALAAAPAGPDGEARLAADWAARMAEAPARGLPRLSDPADGELVRGVLDRSRFAALPTEGPGAARGLIAVCRSGPQMLNSYLGWSEGGTADKSANQARFAPEIVGALAFTVACNGRLAAATKALVASEPPGAVSPVRVEALARMEAQDVRMLRGAAAVAVSPALSAGQRATVLSAMVEAVPEFIAGSSESDRAAISGILKGMVEKAPDEATRSAIMPLVPLAG